MAPSPLEDWVRVGSEGEEGGGGVVGLGHAGNLPGISASGNQTWETQAAEMSIESDGRVAEEREG
jgi:hypothetical protein